MKVLQLLLLLPAVLLGEIIQEEFYKDSGITKIILQNGLVMYLHPCSQDNEDLLIRFVAKGGYASVDKHKRASAEIAPLVAWDSGIGGMDVDALYAYMWKNDMEFSPKFLPYSRVIDASINTEGKNDEKRAGELLRFVRNYFTHNNFTKEGFERTVAQLKIGLKEESKDADVTYEEFYQKINTGGVEALSPLTVQNLQDVDFATSKKIFEQSFSNPGDFTGFIVGDFNVEEMKKEVDTILSQIPKKPPFAVGAPPSGTFPKEVQVKNILHKGRLEGTTRITFPYTGELSQKKFPAFILALQVMEAGLKEEIRKKLTYSHGIDIAYEYPYYPYNNELWISIQFCCAKDNGKKIISIALNEIRKMQKEGVSKRKFEEVKQLHKGSEQFWVKDNDYLMSRMTNTFFWGWDMKDVSFSAERFEKVTLEQLEDIIANGFVLDHYTILSIKPE